MERKRCRLLKPIPALCVIIVMQISVILHVQKKYIITRKLAYKQSSFKLIPLYFPNIPDKLIFAVPNGGSRHVREAANLKRQGVKPGVSDVIVLIPKKGFASLCIEFKTRVGKQSEEQKEFQKQAESCRNKYVVVRSASQAIEELQKYLS